MKRAFLMLSVLIAALVVRGQDSAGAQTFSRGEAEENYKMLKGKVEDLTASSSAQAKMIQELRAEIRDLRAQLAKPTGNFASPEDVKALRDALAEVDRKRIADNNELKTAVTTEIGKLAKLLNSAPPPAAPPKATKPPKQADNHTEDTTSNTGSQTKPADKPQTQLPENVFVYEIKPNDTYRKIAKLYNDQGVKVTSDEIAAANPTMKETGLIVGKKINIPAKSPPTVKE